VAALVQTWDAPAVLLAPGVEALGSGARRRANRVTRGDTQLRLDEECRWHPFVRVDGEWQLAGRCTEDPATAVLSLPSATGRTRTT
jgi:hypothetical protein